MPIRLNLDLVMMQRKVSLTELAGRVGLTLANLSILKTNKARAVRFSTLEALCRELQCQPGKLLEFVGSSEAEMAAPEPASSSPTPAALAPPPTPRARAAKPRSAAHQSPAPTAPEPETPSPPVRFAEESSRGLPGDYY